MLQVTTNSPVSTSTAAAKQCTARRRNSYKISIENGATTMDANSSSVSSSNTSKKFRIIVKQRSFEVDPVRMSRLSPIFAAVCRIGNGMEREIVDEKAEDISTFLQCIDSTKKIDREYWSSTIKPFTIPLSRVELHN